MQTLKLRNFTSGVETGKRLPSTSHAYTLKNFDHFTEGELTPYNSSVSEATSNDYNTLYAIRALTQANGALYGLGVDESDASVAKVYKRTIASMSSGVWSSYSVSNSLVLARNGIMNTPDFFHNYRNYIYFADSIGIKRVQLSGSPSITTSQAITTINSATNGITHSKDNKLYFAYNDTTSPNTIPYMASFDNSSWNTTALTMPDIYKASSICEYNNYIAIGLAPKDINGRSVVYIWDRDSSLSTITESIDWGYGELRVLEQVEGRLIGISITGDSATRIKPKIIVREYDGVTAKVIMELESSTTTINLGTSKQKIQNKLYFTASIVQNGVTNTGVWVIGKASPNSPWSIALDRTPNNDSEITDTIGLPEGFYLLGDYMFIAYDYNGSNSGSLNRTTSTSTTYSATSILETLKNPSMPINDRGLTKKLYCISAAYTPLPSAGQVVVKYKVDDGSWITVYTDSTDSSTGFEAVMDANGDSFTDGKEYEFRVESTGGAEIVELAYRYETLISNTNG